MFLSCLKMPLAEPSAQRLLADPYSLHRALMNAFPPQAGRVLFRIEPLGWGEARATILVQSIAEPRWSPALLPPGTAVDLKPFDPALREGQRLRFRLRANPTARRKVEDREKGIRVGVVGEDRQRQWLEAKGEAGGFRPQGVVVIDEGQVMGRKPSGGHRLTFQSVRFEGVLTVTNPDRFLGTIQAGIGSGKAFGFGLLSVARA